MEAKAMDLNEWSVVDKELRDLTFVSQQTLKEGKCNLAGKIHTGFGLQI